jgi:8-oxo-dGTP diphosphatase
MISLKPLEHFDPKFEVVSCFFRHKEKILLLHRAEEEGEGNRWGLPGGKVEKGETLKEALFREIKEETNIELKYEDVVFLKRLYVRYPNQDFIYDMFYSELAAQPVVKTNPEEHQGFLWITPEDALKLKLVSDGADCIRLFSKLI